MSAATRIIKVRFLENGKQAPSNSRFKGVITPEIIFGKNGLVSYYSRLDANGDVELNSYLDYVSREMNGNEVEIGNNKYDIKTMTNKGILFGKDKTKFMNELKKSFAEDGHILWDFVFSIKDFDIASMCDLRSTEDYQHVLERVMPKLIKDMGMIESNTNWFAFYHNNTDHPHIHLSMMEDKQTRTRKKISKKELDNLKKNFIVETLKRQEMNKSFGLGYKKLLKDLDYKSKDLKTQIKNIELIKFKEIEDLIGKLPKKGRIQYNSYHMKNYRNELDLIVDHVLHDEKIYPVYEDLLKLMEELDKNIDHQANHKVARIKESEDKKLRVEIANLILKEIKNIKNGDIVINPEELQDVAFRKEISIRQDGDKVEINVKEFQKTENKSLSNDNDVSKLNGTLIERENKTYKKEKMLSKFFSKRMNRKIVNFLKRRSEMIEREIEKYLTGNSDISY